VRHGLALCVVQLLEHVFGDATPERW
jgi:hypothetical protein